MEDIKEFENQLEQEKLVKAKCEINDNRTRVDEDGTVFEFDPVKRAWFPKIDEDFIANYQMNYGNYIENSEPISNGAAAREFSLTDPPPDTTSEEYRKWYEMYQQYNASQLSKQKSTASERIESNDSIPPENKASTSTETLKRKAADPVWFEVDELKNTNVYVTGLPTDMTDEEYKELMTKVGMVAFDPVLRAPKLKLYRNPDGSLKGDGRCCYMKVESVDMALQILDGYNLRGHKISVEKAKFQQKGQYDPAKKKRKLTKQEKIKFKESQERLLGWNLEKPNSRPKFHRICVVKNVFQTKDFDEDSSLYDDITSDMKEECTKYGEVKKVTVYDRNEEGVVVITFKTPEEADKCIGALNGRWFGGRQLVASSWDGKTKYLVKETEQEMTERCKKWHSVLEM